MARQESVKAQASKDAEKDTLATEEITGHFGRVRCQATASRCLASVAN
jgi:hypothetical protein